MYKVGIVVGSSFFVSKLKTKPKKGIILDTGLRDEYETGIRRVKRKGLDSQE